MPALRESWAEAVQQERYAGKDMLHRQSLSESVSDTRQKDGLQCGKDAPEHSAAVCINGGNLAIVTGIDGTEGGVQRVPGPPTAQLYACSHRQACFETPTLAWNAVVIVRCMKHLLI